MLKKILDVGKGFIKDEGVSLFPDHYCASAHQQFGGFCFVNAFMLVADFLLNSESSTKESCGWRVGSGLARKCRLLPGWAELSPPQSLVPPRIVGPCARVCVFSEH